MRGTVAVMMRANERLLEQLTRRTDQAMERIEGQIKVKLGLCTTSCLAITCWLPQDLDRRISARVSQAETTPFRVNRSFYFAAEPSPYWQRPCLTEQLKLQPSVGSRHWRALLLS